jgi:hypothetical protein
LLLVRPEVTSSEFTVDWLDSDCWMLLALDESMSF